MYLYFDKTGTLKEVINDPVRAGESNKKVYIYIETLDEGTPNAIWSKYRKADGSKTSTYQISTQTRTGIYIPYDEKRDLKFFNYNTAYTFWEVVIPDAVLNTSGSSEVQSIEASFFVALNNAIIKTLSLVAIAIDPALVSIAQDENINIAQWNELLKTIASAETLSAGNGINISSGGVISIDTSVVSVLNGGNTYTGNQTINSNSNFVINKGIGTNKVFEVDCSGNTPQINFGVVPKYNNVSFALINDIVNYSAGDGLTLTGTSFSVNTIDNVNDTSAVNPLSAKQGKLLNDRIDNLSSIGRYLSGWNCATGQPTTQPTSLPYVYHTGDYYVVSNVGASNNKMPSGTQYTGQASSTTISEVFKNDIFRFDGTTWQREANTGKVYVGGNNISISGNTINAVNVVTTDTTQYITGEKSFRESVKVENGINLNDDGSILSDGDGDITINANDNVEINANDGNLNIYADSSLYLEGEYTYLTTHAFTITDYNANDHDLKCSWYDDGHGGQTFKIETETQGDHIQIVSDYVNINSVGFANGRVDAYSLKASNNAPSTAVDGTNYYADAIKRGSYKLSYPTLTQNETIATREWVINDSILAKKLYNISELLKGHEYTLENGDSPAYIQNVPAGSQRYAELGMIGGKCYVENQLINLSGLTEQTINGVTFTPNASNGTITLNGTATDNANYKIFDRASFITGHKYCVLGSPSSSTTSTYTYFDGNDGAKSGNYIITGNTSLNHSTFIRVESGQTVSNIVFMPQFIDLTIYPSSATTPSQFLQDNPQYNDYVAYNTGTLKIAKVNKVVSKGFNIWNEEWEVGAWDEITGAKSVDSSRIRCNDYIPCLPNTTYYYQVPSGFGNIKFVFYDNSKNKVDYYNFSTEHSFTTPSNCLYMTFNTAASYGTTYNHDICINLSNASLNGTYKPHRANIDFNIPSQILALDGYGYSAGSVYNYVDFPNKEFNDEVGVVDLGSLNWVKLSDGLFYSAGISTIAKVNGATFSIYGSQIYLNTSNSNLIASGFTQYADAQAFKTAMSGIKLYYQKATPTKIDISQYLPDDIYYLDTQAGGTITFSQVDTQVSVPNTLTYMVRNSEVI